jgi:isoleucyl-tRNA synthetase
VREDVLKSLEEARREKFIGAPLEARVRLTANSDIYPLLEEYAGELPGLFIVSQVNVAPASACDGLSPEIGIKIERADGSKCERCWKYTTDTGSDPQFPTICAACADAVKETLHA